MIMLTAQELGFPPRPKLLRKPNGTATNETDITGIDILADIEKFIRRFLILPEDAYLPLATLVAATYVADAFDAFPYLALTSPTKRCGKTRTLEIFEVLCANPLRITSPSAAALFRMMADRPTLLVDEVEALKAKNASEVSQAILAILNAGYRRGATVPRCEPPKNNVVYFAVYGPKVFAAIGSLPDTLADRSICIAMQRRAKLQKVERFSQRRTPKEAELIRDLLKKWSESQRENISRAYDENGDLEWLEDRDAEIWLPLFVVCAIAAPDRVEELKNCALALTKTKAADDAEDSLSIKLLADVREVWPQNHDKVPTETLIKSLKAIPESPWGEAGHELTARRLAARLRPFGARPRDLRTSSEKTGIKGYLWVEIEDAFLRYLPPGDEISATCATTRINTGKNDDF